MLVSDQALAVRQLAFEQRAGILEQDDGRGRAGVAGDRLETAADCGNC
jgi:hypothetical protein